MQLTSPLFLFAFLPLSLAPLLVSRPRHRKAIITALSLIWLLFVNRHDPLSLVPIAAVVAVTCLLSALPDRAPRVRLAFGISLPLAALLAARLLAEYAPFAYSYPTGLTMVTLAAISVAIDRYRGDAPEREAPFAVIAYLIFFPTMLVGPILRYKQFLRATERISPLSRETIARGALLFMRGYVKRIALAAVLMRAFSDLFTFGEAALPPLALLLLLLTAYALFYAFVTGTTDMARGIMAILGIQPPRGQSGSVSLLLPHRVLASMLLPFDRYLEDYVARPLRSKLRGKWGRLLAATLSVLFTVLLYRTRPEVLLLALPLFLCAWLSASRARTHRFPRQGLARLAFGTISSLAISILVLGIMLDDPFEIFTLALHAFDGSATYSVYYLFGAIADARYLAPALVLTALSPILHYYPILARRIPKRADLTLRCVSMALLLLAFVGAILYFLPQFPQYADPAYGTTVFVR